MKKCLFLLAFLPVLLNAADYSLQLRTGYFYMHDHTARKIYNHGGMDVEMEGSRKLTSHLDLWTNLNYFTKKGHSSGLHDRTRIHLTTLSLGLKYNWTLSSHVRFYLGAGATGAYLDMKDHSSYVHRSTYKTGLGGVAKSGFVISFCGKYFLDLFADYYYQPMHFHNHGHKRLKSYDANLGGVRTGIGLGLNF